MNESNVVCIIRFQRKKKILLLIIIKIKIYYHFFLTSGLNDDLIISSTLKYMSYSGERVFCRRVMNYINHTNELFGSRCAIYFPPTRQRVLVRRSHIRIITLFRYIYRYVLLTRTYVTHMECLKIRNNLT